MKKIFIFLAIIVVILCVILYQYNSYQRAQNAINSENSEYEQYLDKEIYGIDIASLINKSTEKILFQKMTKVTLYKMMKILLK